MIRIYNIVIIVFVILYYSINCGENEGHLFGDVEIHKKTYYIKQTSEFENTEIVETGENNIKIYHNKFNDFFSINDSSYYIFFIGDYNADTLTLIREKLDIENNYAVSYESIFHKILYSNDANKFVDSVTTSFENTDKENVKFIDDCKLIIKNEIYQFELPYSLMFVIIEYIRDEKTIKIEMTNKAPDFLRE